MDIFRNIIFLLFIFFLISNGNGQDCNVGKVVELWGEYYDMVNLTLYP